VYGAAAKSESPIFYTIHRKIYGFIRTSTKRSIGYNLNACYVTTGNSRGNDTLTASLQEKAK